MNIACFIRKINAQRKRPLKFQSRLAAKYAYILPVLTTDQYDKNEIDVQNWQG